MTTGANLFDLFVAHGVTTAEIAAMDVDMMTLHVGQMRQSEPDELRLTSEEIARLILAYAQASAQPTGLTCGLCGETVDPSEVDAHLSSHTVGLFVNVWTLRPWLALSAGVQGGRETLRQLADDEHTPALVAALTQVVEDVGGALNMSGRYYIPDVTAYPAIAEAVLHGTWED